MTSTTGATAQKQDDAGAPPASNAEPGSKHKTEEEEVEASEAKRAKTSDDSKNAPADQKAKTKTEATEESTASETPATPAKKEGATQPKSNESKESKEDTEAQPKEEDDSAVEPHGHDNVPSSILEKGIIYFFFRGRVNIEEPSAVDDIARTYILLRPIAKDAKLGSGPIGDAGNSRVCVVPKKVLPQTGKDRWISFVEKTGASFQQLKEEFLKGNDYDTKTAGTRHTPAATPVGEGVYAITSTGRESHLVYMLTLPEKLGEVQKEMGLKSQGSFIISTKNPQYPGPANARLPKGPEYSEE